MPDEDLANLSNEQLLTLEESLYDLEVEGMDIWFERDQILNEIRKRDIPKRDPKVPLDRPL